MVGGIELLAAYVSLGLYQEGQLFLEKDLRETDLSGGKSIDMLSLYDLALSLKLRKFDKVFVETTKDALHYDDALSIEKQMLLASLLIESGRLRDAKKIISSVESAAGDAPKATRIQITIRRLQIAIYEHNEGEANTQVKLLESAIAAGIEEDEVIARSNAILGVYWFARSRDEISAGHFMKSAKTYREKYGDRHPKFLEAMLAYKLVVRGNSIAAYPNANDSLSSLLILEGLRQAYPQDHPIVELAESLVTDDRSLGFSSSPAADRDEVFKGLLILS